MRLANVVRSVDPNEKSRPGRCRRSALHRCRTDPGITRSTSRTNPPPRPRPRRCFVEDYLDSERDWSTFALGEVGFGDHAVARLKGKTQRPNPCGTRRPWRSMVEAQIVENTGLVQWTFRTLDPPRPPISPCRFYDACRETGIQHNLQLAGDSPRTSWATPPGPAWQFFRAQRPEKGDLNYDDVVKPVGCGAWVCRSLTGIDVALDFRIQADVDGDLKIGMAEIRVRFSGTGPKSGLNGLF